jgi:hypothetical protein
VGEDRLILPLGHSEDLKYQEPAVNRADELVEEATAEQRALLEFSATQARDIET